MTRPAGVFRPLGVTIAIVGAAVFFGLRPLGEVYFLWRLDATAEEAYISGGVGIDAWTWFEGVWGALVLVICVLSWWGRPSWIRHVLIGSLFLPLVLTLYRVIEAMRAVEDPIFGGQLQETVRNYLQCQGPVLVLVALYVTWYLNRAPARAFYRRVPLASLQPDWMRQENEESETT